MLRNAQKRRLSTSSTVESREGVLLELLEDAAVTIQRLKWELESKSVCLSSSNAGEGRN